mmetsp:Transcript_37916/g.108320  ORF Transcript_37916/g.108320 Transcript_37916/m.108320 type:complete len:206 (-) Transcript_37916:803-1420(-)
MIGSGVARPACAARARRPRKGGRLRRPCGASRAPRSRCWRPCLPTPAACAPCTPLGHPCWWTSRPWGPSSPRAWARRSRLLSTLGWQRRCSPPRCQPRRRPGRGRPLCCCCPRPAPRRSRRRLQVLLRKPSRWRIHLRAWLQACWWRPQHLRSRRRWRRSSAWGRAAPWAAAPPARKRTRPRRPRRGPSWCSPPASRPCSAPRRS